MENHRDQDSEYTVSDALQPDIPNSQAPEKKWLTRYYQPFLTYRINVGIRKRGRGARNLPSSSDVLPQSLSKLRSKPRSAERRPWSCQDVCDSDELLQSFGTTPLTLYRSGGGTHQDPFDSLPANPDIPEVGNALDFCMFPSTIETSRRLFDPLFTDGCMPKVLSIWCTTRPSAQSANSYIPAVVSEAIRKETILESLVTYGQAYHEIIHQKQARPSRGLLSRQGRLLKHLRRLLLRPEREAMDEAILLVLNIIAIGRLTGVPAHEISLHFEGVGHLIYRQGGVNNLGLRGVLKAAIVAQKFHYLFATSASPSLPNSLQQNIPAHVPAIAFTYESHGSASETLQKVCSLPYGLSMLATSGSLSYELIRILIDFQDWLIAPRSTDGDTMLLATMHLAHELLHALTNNARIQMDLLNLRPWRIQCLETIVCLGLLMLTAEIFYGPQIHAIAPQLAARMHDVARTRFWSFDDQPKALPEDTILARKCMAWGLMVAAEAVDPCYQDQHAQLFMDTIFDMQFFDAEDFTLRVSEQANEAEMAFERFHESTLKQFLCPVFLVKEWKRCWMKYWNRRDDRI